MRRAGNILWTMISNRLRSTPVPGIRDEYTGIDFNLGFHVRAYDLSLDYRVAPNRLDGTATLHLDNWRALQTMTLDPAQGMRVAKVTAQGTAGRTIQVQRFRHTGGKLRLSFRE